MSKVVFIIFQGLVKIGIMRKNKKHLAFYNACMKTRSIPRDGLCCCDAYISLKLLDLFEPTISDCNQLSEQGLSVGYWASGLNSYAWGKYREFTPLRQTIVLFMAAINNEL